MIDIRVSRPADATHLFQTWSEAVNATHHLLMQKDRIAIAPDVRAYVVRTRLWVAAHGNDDPIGFMGLSRREYGRALHRPCLSWTRGGEALVAYAVGSRSVLTTDVNEQTEAAIGFYARSGFKRAGRSPADQEGRTYPLIHMRLERHNFRAS